MGNLSSNANTRNVPTLTSPPSIFFHVGRRKRIDTRRRRREEFPEERRRRQGQWRRRCHFRLANYSPLALSPTLPTRTIYAGNGGIKFSRRFY